jgi:hypothetical protein
MSSHGNNSGDIVFLHAGDSISLALFIVTLCRLNAEQVELLTAYGDRFGWAETGAGGSRSADDRTSIAQQANVSLGRVESFLACRGSQPLHEVPSTYFFPCYVLATRVCESRRLFQCLTRIAWVRPSRQQAESSRRDPPYWGGGLRGR